MLAAPAVPSSFGFSVGWLAFDASPVPHSGNWLTSILLPVEICGRLPVCLGTLRRIFRLCTVPRRALAGTQIIPVFLHPDISLKGQRAKMEVGRET